MLGLRQHCRVVGNSMLPTLQDGDLLIYKKYKHIKNNLEEGSLVILKHPLKKNTLIIKRVFKLNSKNLEVRGDNALESIDSRKFGLINYTQIEGIVEHIFPKNLKSILN